MGIWLRMPSTPAIPSAENIDGWRRNSQQTLFDVVAEAGLDRNQAEAMLNSNEDLLAIKRQEWRFRVEGVPFFIVNGQITLYGAQSSDSFLAAFEQASDSKQIGPAS